jgi:hypothetical protein
MGSPAIRQPECLDETRSRFNAQVVDISMSPVLNGFTPPPSEEAFSSIKIADWGEPKIGYKKGVGQTETSLVQLKDGSSFVFRKTIPDNQVWESSVDFTPPLATRVNGFNSYLARKLAQAGIHNRLVGTNQAYGFSLKHDALATLAILNRDDKQQKKNKDVTCLPGESAVLGYSMGEMKGLAMTAYASEAGRTVLFNQGLDPCLETPVDYAKEGEDLVGLALYLGRETLEIPLIFAKNFDNGLPHRQLLRSIHLARTIGLTPTYFRNGKDKWDVIATGETGTFLKDLPQEAIVALNFFEKGRFKDPAKFTAAIGNNPNTRITVENGYHLSGANPKVIERVIRRTATALSLTERGSSASDVADALQGPILRVA